MQHQMNAIIGATHSKAVICDRFGSIISKVAGPSTNHWVCGIPEVARRIADMIESAKKQANIDIDLKLQSLGLSLSGCEQDATNKVLENELLDKYPNLSKSYYVCSDTMGSIFTASPLGGMVLIAGTGSNALLRNPDGSTYTCGGWGAFLADEGAAFRIAHKAVKTVFDHEDKLILSPYDTSATWEQIKKHFNIETRYDLLDHCYAKFDKAFFASMCEKLSHLASAGDELCLHLFEDAGISLAKATMALLPNVSDQLLTKNNLNIVCVGSVWKSWTLLQNGFKTEIAKATNKFGLNLITLTQAMAIGAAYLAADSINYDLPRDYSHNYNIFQHIPPNDGSKTNGTHTNGTYTNGNGVAAKKIQTNGNGSLSNGKYTNGTSNGTSNGTTNGTSNGSTYGKSNGTSNGMSNGASNGGTPNGKYTNGIQAKKGLKTRANASPSTILVQDG
ncbi:N-acetyl-D-glucosamine kinase isoform X2 [Sitodiplosis mosellana]|uniref:N-acetyl-D-glucosamine kinase isoform X2 n=1 Tax=Sitodiplosis mosellana TaxID=263140 RepID=UPI00244512B3|nr:N-acetyl-D-glucosamine kinase isoform X2 [Sitodiplosis mosellana]